MEKPKTPRKSFYSAPDQLPGGFLDLLQPIAAWLLLQLRAAYDRGYTDGRADAAAARCEASYYRDLEAYVAHMSQPVPKV